MALNKKWLKYRAKDGILRVHLDADGGRAAFSELVKECLGYSEHETGEYCLMDTFLSDSLSVGNLEQIFQKADKGQVKILLADPNSYFAKHRAATIGEIASFQRSSDGLKQIGEALGIDNQLTFPSPNNVENLLPLINQIKNNAPIKLRFYSDITSGPLYFFKNIVLSGHFSTGKSAIRFPWLMVINDPHQKHDFYDELRNEFEYVWGKSNEFPNS